MAISGTEADGWIGLIYLSGTFDFYHWMRSGETLTSSWNPQAHVQTVDSMYLLNGIDGKWYGHELNDNAITSGYWCTKDPVCFLDKSSTLGCKYTTKNIELLSTTETVLTLIKTIVAEDSKCEYFSTANTTSTTSMETQTRYGTATAVNSETFTKPIKSLEDNTASHGVSYMNQTYTNVLVFFCTAYLYTVAF